MSAIERDAMLRALTVAAHPSLPHGPNPRVGCVLLDQSGTVLAEGWHRGAGSPHAEVDALNNLPSGLMPHTAVVTLEPCNHKGRTGPCSHALAAAGVRRVVAALPDPHTKATGGAAWLRAHGIEAIFAEGDLAEAAHDVNRGWITGITKQRPWVTWKYAMSIDGFSAPIDRSQRWLTSTAARADVHRLRARHDAILVGTGTVLADDPQLTVRGDSPSIAEVQPTPIVMGLREVPQRARLRSHPKPLLTPHTRDPHEVLAQLMELGLRDVFVEGGPTVGTAFLRAGVVDEIVCYVAPTLLGHGLHAIGDLTGGPPFDRWRLLDVQQFGPDARLVLRPPQTTQASEGI